jgi:hypothetical protein
MTILAITEDYLVEYESGLLTISRYTDGYCLGFSGRRVAGEFRDCLKTHTADKVIETYIKIARGAQWEPMYKPHRMPRKSELETTFVYEYIIFKDGENFASFDGFAKNVDCAVSMAKFLSTGV